MPSGVSPIITSIPRNKWKSLIQKHNQFVLKPQWIGISYQVKHLYGNHSNPRSANFLLTTPPVTSSMKKMLISTKHNQTTTNAIIHPTAIVESGAQIGKNVKIGPYCIVGADVILEDNVELHAHALVKGHTKISENTKIYSFACIGESAQDKKFCTSMSSSSSSVVIGKNCVIREHVTINCGTPHCKNGLDKGGVTSIGDDTWILAGSHVGHDSSVGDRVVLANNVCLAGHVRIDNNAIIGGQSGIRQFVHIGSLAMIGGKSAVDADVIPFGLVQGNRAHMNGLNLVGLRRLQLPRSEIKSMLRVYRYLFQVSHSKSNAFAPPLDLPPCPTLQLRAKEVQKFLFATQDKRPTQNNNSFDKNSLLPSQILSVDLMVNFILHRTSQKRNSLCLPSLDTHKAK